MAQFRVGHDSVQGAAWLILACGVAQLGCSVIQYRVRRASVEGCDVAPLRTGRGLVRVQPGSVRVRRGSVQGAAWHSTGCGMAQLKCAALAS